MGLFGDKQRGFQDENDRRDRYKNNNYDDNWVEDDYRSSSRKSRGGIFNSINKLLKFIGFFFVAWFVLKIIGALFD